MCQKKEVVGIFSREHASCYEWLIDLLLDSSLVRDVRRIYISNKTRSLRQEIRQCTFGILYHTKNRGRINVTDVTDSLYDEELKDLSVILGRKNVIVLIDDVESASDEEKMKILECQPSIEKLAKELVLINQIKTKASWKKNQPIQHIIRAHNRRLWNKILPVVTIVVGLLFMIMVLYKREKQQSSVPQTTASPWNITANTTATI